MITTILLDYGNVLGYPASGNWFLTPNTRKTVGTANFARLNANADKLADAFAVAKRYLDDNHRLTTEAEEYAQFTEFYHRLAAGLGVRLSVEICETLSHEHVYSDVSQLLYPDVLPAVRALKEQYKVGILSDTWPSLRRRLTNAGITPHLDALVMSCDHGITKENTRLFEIAVEQIGETAESILFVDDTEANLQNAKAVGMRPVLMDRDGKAQSSKFPIIRNLAEIAVLAARA